MNEYISIQLVKIAHFESFKQLKSTEATGDIFGLKKWGVFLHKI